MAKKYSAKISLKNKSKGRRKRKPVNNNKFNIGVGSDAGKSSSRSGTSRSRTAKSNQKSRKYNTFANWKSTASGRVSGSKKLSTKGFRGVLKNKKFQKVAYTSVAAIFIVGFFGLVGVLAYMQSLTRDLPDPERPFDNEKFQAEASIIYDRNGEELYRLFGEDNRDIVRIQDDKTLDETVPPELKWSFLAAEDIDFYEHPGFDVTGIIRCGIRNAIEGRTACGGSTITQQVVKLAALEDNTRSIERKLRELVLALQLEREVDDKDRILLLYMNIAPQGGNMYGIRTAAKNYYGKDVTELTLAESVTLAAIPNNPALLSPTRSVNPELGSATLEGRRNVIFDNLIRHKDKINREHLETLERIAEREGRELTDEEKEPFITEEKVEEARNTELAYQDAGEDILAPHFVFFARETLTQRDYYNNGEQFTLQQINTGGYRIYTTLDIDIQETALDVVQNQAVAQYGARYGNKNAALMSMKPGTGEIIAMVGSKCYSDRELDGCSELDISQGDQFDPQVNILTTDQQPGSSIKPLVYYMAFEEGVLGPGSQLADIPIKVGDYEPKNSDGRFSGIHDVRYMISLSRNIPAIASLMAVGPERLAEVKGEMGYSTNLDPSTYGPSAALGSQDVYGVEHANGFATLANGGRYVPYEPILRIEDKNGDVIFDLEGDDAPEGEQVLDERAAFMTNDITNPRGRTGGQSPVKWNSNRDMAGKTGTSENNRDTWFVNYSPDFVTVGWSGNNDNSRMAGNAFGSTNTEPWVRVFMERVGESEHFSAKTPFRRPGGIATGQSCSKVEVNGTEQEVCSANSDYFIEGKKPPAYFAKQTVQVCRDQQDRLARPIDIQTGNAIEREFDFVRMPVAELQDDLERYLEGKQGGNGAPTEMCTVNRSPNGENPWAEINNPVAGSTYTGTISASIDGYATGGASVTGIEFYLGETQLGNTSGSSFNGTLNVPAGSPSGTYTFRVVTKDSNGRAGETSINIDINGADTDLTLVAPSNGSTKPVNTTTNVVANYTGSLSNLRLFAQRQDGSASDVGGLSGSGGSATGNWTPTQTGTYELWVRAVSGSFTSNPSPRITVVVE